MNTRRSVLVYLMSAVVLVAGCGGSPQPQALSSPTASVPAIASLVDARWIGFDMSGPWNWQEVERLMTPVFQRFGFRPVGETRTPHHCEGCGEHAPTAEVTVYTPGAYDPAGARTGQPVDVNGRNAFFGVPQRDHAATDPSYPLLDPSEVFDSVLLVWEYADNAWATVRGMSPMAGDLDRLLELAQAVRPDERTPVKVPLSLGFVPATMPLVAVHTDSMSVYGQEHGDIGTTLSFGPCVTLVKAQECAEQSDRTGSLAVQVLNRDEYRESSVMHLVDRQMGSIRGKADETYPLAEVLLQKGYVEFNVHPRGGLDSTPEQDAAARKELDAVLDGVTWAPDPGDESTWQPITDWVK